MPDLSGCQHTISFASPCLNSQHHVNLLKTHDWPMYDTCMSLLQSSIWPIGTVHGCAGKQQPKLSLVKEQTKPQVRYWKSLSIVLQKWKRYLITFRPRIIHPVFGTGITYEGNPTMTYHWKSIDSCTCFMNHTSKLLAKIEPKSGHGSNIL